MKRVKTVRSTRTSPTVCPLAPLPGRGVRERLPHGFDLCPRIGAKMPQGARRKVVDREVAGSGAFGRANFTVGKLFAIVLEARPGNEGTRSQGAA
jgi:hypothetical protein